MRAGADGASGRPATSKDAETPITTSTASNVRRLSTVVIGKVTSKVRRGRYRRGSPVTMPGSAVGAGRALTDGEYELPPAPEPRAFSPAEVERWNFGSARWSSPDAPSYRSRRHSTRSYRRLREHKPSTRASEPKMTAWPTNPLLPMFMAAPPDYMSDGPGRAAKESTSSQPNSLTANAAAVRLKGTTSDQRQRPVSRRR